MKAWRAGTFHLSGMVLTWLGKNYKAQTLTQKHTRREKHTHTHICIQYINIFISAHWLSAIYPTLFCCSDWEGGGWSFILPASNFLCTCPTFCDSVFVQCQPKMEVCKFLPSCHHNPQAVHDCGWEAAKLSHTCQQKPDNSKLSEFKHWSKVFVFRWTATRFNSLSQSYWINYGDNKTWHVLYALTLADTVIS